MTLTILTNNKRFVWNTGEDLADLQHALTLLTQYAEELAQPATVAQMPQLPINTKP